MQTKPKKLVQTRVPERTYSELAKLAAKSGVSIASWVRQLLLKETGTNGLGGKA